jgi:nucleoside-diphosphate-sugar epimerase
MHVLLIGGTGLISTAIATRLLREGHRVTLYNRGRSENRLPSGAEVIIGDRSQREAFEAAFAGRTFDVAVDMIAFHPDDCLSAERALGGKVGHFIHCSTVCVYSGPVQQHPTTETEPYHSIGGYGANKIACEGVLLRAHAERGFPVTIMRPSHSYGDSSGLIRPFGPHEVLVDRLRKGRPLIVNDGGNSLWAACHVDDVAVGFIAVMGKPACIGQAYHICGEEPMTWNQYHEQVAEVVGGAYVPVYIPTDVLRRCAPAWAGGTWEIFAWPSVFTMHKLKRDAAYPGQTISWKQGVARAVAWLEERGRIVDSGTEQQEDRLIAAWRERIAGLPVVKP